jgi:hypothetical protein
MSLYNFCSMFYFVSDKYVAGYARVALRSVGKSSCNASLLLSYSVGTECLSLGDAPSILHFLLCYRMEQTA